MPLLIVGKQTHLCLSLELAGVLEWVQGVHNNQEKGGGDKKRRQMARFANGKEPGSLGARYRGRLKSWPARAT